MKGILLFLMSLGIVLVGNRSQAANPVDCDSNRWWVMLDREGKATKDDIASAFELMTMRQFHIEYTSYHLSGRNQLGVLMSFDSSAYSNPGSGASDRKDTLDRLQKIPGTAVRCSHITP